MTEPDIVTLIPRFVITQGAPPVRQHTQNSEVSASLDAGDTLLPADVEPYEPPRPMPARSLLRRLPVLD